MTATKARLRSSIAIQASADNGIYGTRTPGDTQIVGGTYFNNEVAQIRFCGQGSFADGVTLGVDADSYSGPAGDSAGYNQKIGMQVVKIEQPSHISKPGGVIIRNAEIQARSANKMGAVSSFAVTVERSNSTIAE